MQRTRSLKLALIAIVAIALALAGGCSGDDAGGSRGWDCINGTSGLESCSCAARSDGVSKLRGPACRYYACCLLSEPQPGSASATCKCGASTACEAEAASRPGTSVVAECPPPEEQPAPRCASAETNCSASYLLENSFEGCCGGMVCKANASGVRVCTPGS